MLEQTSTIVNEINKLADQSKADLGNNYLKYSVSFIGVTSGINQNEKLNEL